MQRSGIIEKDEVWSGEITVTGDVVIPEQVTVTVAAGSVIRFEPVSSWNSDEITGILAARNAESWLPEKFVPERCYILVKGALIVAGTEDNGVTVGNEGWGGGIIFRSDKESSIEHAAVTYASYAICHLEKAKTRIRRSEIGHNIIGLFYLGAAIAARIEGSTIYANTHGIVMFGSAFENAMDIRITGNTITGNGGHGIWASWVNPAVRENRILNNDIGINQVSVRAARIEDNEIAENRVGIYANDVAAEEIVGNAIHDNTDEGVLNFLKVQKVTISGNTFMRNTKAVECTDVDEGAVTDNIVSHGRVGMRFQGHMRGEVSGNRISAVAQTGMECLGTVKLKVAGNTFTGMDGGIKVAGNAELEITGNEIRQAESGILCIEEARVTIENNTISAAGTGISCVGQGEGRIKDNRILGAGGTGQPDAAVKEDH